MEVAPRYELDNLDDFKFSDSDSQLGERIHELGTVAESTVRAIAAPAIENYFYNETLRVYVPKGSTKGMTTSDDPQVVGEAAGYKYDNSGL